MKQTFAERLRGKLQTLGLSSRKAKELSKKLVPTASKAPVRGTVTGKLIARLQTLGMTERKATEMAKGLAPLVRANIKAKAKVKKLTLDEVTDDLVNESVAEVMAKEVAPMKGIKGIELFRVMDGLTTTATYLVAAVKSDRGIVAVRQFDPEHYNVKFYPDMAYWGMTSEDLHEKFDAVDHLKREWYERCHFTNYGLAHLLVELAQKAKPKSRMKALVDRFMSVMFVPLAKAFDYLHKRKGVAA